MLLHLGPFITFRPSTEGHDFFRKKNSNITPPPPPHTPQVKNVPSLSVRFGSITTIREITPRSSEQTVVCSEDLENGDNQAYITLGHVIENKLKISYFVFKGRLERWIGPYKLNQNLTLSNFIFSSSWLQRQLAVRPPIIIGMVRHVSYAPSVGQGTEWKLNVAKSKTQSVKSVGLDTIGRITRVWRSVWSKLIYTQ